jgi:hypothetical protein
MKLTEIMQNPFMEKLMEYNIFGSILNAQEDLVDELNDEEVKELYIQLQDKIMLRREELIKELEKTE